MYVICTVRIEERMHVIRVAIPDEYDDIDIRKAMQFAITTALLERSGYLPAGLTHAVA